MEAISHQAAQACSTLYCEEICNTLADSFHLSADALFLIPTLCQPVTTNRTEIKPPPALLPSWPGRVCNCTELLQSSARTDYWEQETH